MPKGSAFCPASSKSTRVSKSERGGFCADGFGEGAGLAFSEGKIEFSVSQSSEGKGGGRAFYDDAPPGRIKKEFSTEKGSRCIVPEIICHDYLPQGGRMRRQMAICCAALSIFWLSAQVTSAQDRGQARSMVISKNGIVAAESPLAAQAGVRILENGGNAVDAAIATNAMMGVVEPMMNGISGDLFAIVYDAKADKLYGLNASGWAPKGLTIAFLQKQGLREMPQAGINSVTVPGMVDGWQKLADKFGRKKLAEDLSAAIATARIGFPVPEMDAAYWNAAVDLLRSNEAASKVYLPGDRAPKMGEIFKNEDVAWSLQQIAEHGRDAFYKGEIARKILAAEKMHGGAMVEEDLSKYSAE